MALMHEGYRVGNRIRAYDFKPMAGRPERFLEGEITARVEKHGVPFYEVFITDARSTARHGSGRSGGCRFRRHSTTQDA